MMSRSGSPIMRQPAPSVFDELTHEAEDLGLYDDHDEHVAVHNEIRREFKGWQPHNDVTWEELTEVDGSFLLLNAATGKMYAAKEVDVADVVARAFKVQDTPPPPRPNSGAK